MVMLGPAHARAIRRIVIAVLSGFLIAGLGFAALITLAVAWPHNPVPRILLVAWAVLATLSVAIPGAFRRTIRGRGALLLVAFPFLPLARAALTVWRHLPEAVQDFLEGNFRSHRWARSQRKQAR
jgi:hypothetical protein